jgi:hypothetical protein
MFIMFWVKSSVTAECTYVTTHVIGMTVAADFIVMRMRTIRIAYDSNCIADIIDCHIFNQRHTSRINI